MIDQPDEPHGTGAAARRSIQRPGTRARWVGLFGLGMAVAFLAVLLYGALFPGIKQLTQTDVNKSIASALASQTPGPPLSEGAYAAIAPSLVLIEVELTKPKDGSTSGLGSGVIIDDQGDILTSLHVVATAKTIKLTFADGSTSAATVSVKQPENDIAVLQAEQLPADVVPATLGNPKALRVGSEAFVVGNPFGLYSSMSAGVVSGLGRSFQTPDNGPVLHDLIQVDAAVNPGNSGGPLVDRDGRVVGIVAALINPTDERVFVGIGLAVPIDVAGGAAGLPQY
jgi:S1-C subfamily serine protease